MKNMDQGLTVPKWVLIVWPKIPKMPQNLSAQVFCPSTKVPDFNEKRLHWESVVHGCANSWRHTLHKMWIAITSSFSSKVLSYMSQSARKTA